MRKEFLQLNQAEFAEQLGIAQNSLSYIERGERGISSEFIESLSRIFGVSPNWILLGVGEPLLTDHKSGQAETSNTLEQEGPNPSPNPSLNPSPSTKTKYSVPSEQKAEQLTELRKLVAAHKAPRARTIPVLSDMKAAAGYLLVDASTQVDPQYLDEQPTLTLPYNLTPGQWYAFQVEGQSMYPTIHEGDVLAARLVEATEDIQDNHIHIVVSKSEGILVKRVVNRMEQNASIVLRSDNKQYPPINMFFEDVHSIWRVHYRLTGQMADPYTLEARVVELENQYDSFKAEMNQILDKIKSRSKE